MSASPTLPTYCKSATYGLLITMGFPPTMSLTASKLYLNNVEDAVNYCSELSCSQSTDSLSCFLKGENYKKCHDLLQLSHPDYVSLFERWFDEDQFEDEQLIEEFIENNDFKESFFIQYIQDNLEGVSFNDHMAMQIFCDLQDAIRETPPSIVSHHCLLDGYIHEMEHDLDERIPSHINVLVDRYYAKFSNKLMDINPDLFADENLLNDAQKCYLQQCSILSPSFDAAIFHLFVIGKHNNLPLLTYLTDAYNRKRIQLSVKRLNKLHDQFKEEKQFPYKINRWKLRHPVKEYTERQFIRKYFKAFREMPWFQGLCHQSICTLTHNSALGKAALQNPFHHYMDDNFMQIADCILDSYLFVNEYVNTLNYDEMPMQFDVMIIPQRVMSDDSKPHAQCVSMKCVDIETLLKKANSPYVKSTLLKNAECRLELTQFLTTRLLKNKLQKTKLTNERCCILIDRRGNTTDKMFVYQTGHPSDKIISNKEHFVNESLFDNSVRCLVPNLCGAKDPLDGHMLSLSFHVISKYETRVYLYIGGYCTRFHPRDLWKYLPQFFQSDQSSSDVWDDFRNCSQFNKLLDKHQKCENILTDAKFDEFSQMIFC